MVLPAMSVSEQADRFFCIALQSRHKEYCVVKLHKGLQTEPTRVVGNVVSYAGEYHAKRASVAELASEGS